MFHKNKSLSGFYFLFLAEYLTIINSTAIFSLSLPVFTSSSAWAQSASAYFNCEGVKFLACAAYLFTINGAAPIVLAMSALLRPWLSSSCT